MELSGKANVFVERDDADFQCAESNKQRREDRHEFWRAAREESAVMIKGVVIGDSLRAGAEFWQDLGGGD